MGQYFVIDNLEGGLGASGDPREALQGFRLAFPEASGDVFDFGLVSAYDDPMQKMGIAFALCASCLFSQASPYNQAKIDLLYETWTNSCTGITTSNDVVHLNGGEPFTLGFCDEGITVPKVIVAPDGRWFIYGTGDDILVGADGKGAKVIDAIYVIQRLTTGQYKLLPTADPCSGASPQISLPILQFNEDLFDLDHPNGGKVGWLGQGMGVFYSAQGDYCGHHYFGILPVFDKGIRDLEEQPTEERFGDDRAFLAWAFSADGLHWEFMEDFNFVPFTCSGGGWRTTEPKEAHPLLYRDCFQMAGYHGQWGREVFHHLGVFYSDPTKTDTYGQAGDGYVYIFFGYTPGTGIWNLLARVKFEPGSLTGKGEVQLYQNDPDGLYCPAQGSWVTLTECTDHSQCPTSSVNCGNTFSDACIPCGLDVVSNQYVADMVVPFELQPVYKGSQFQYMALFYEAGSTFNSGGRVAMRFSDHIRPPFRFTDERNLGNCLLGALGYSPCGGGGEGIGVVQPPCNAQWVSLGYYDNITQCNLLAFAGYVNATTKVCDSTNFDPPFAPITFNSEGILPVKIGLANSNWAPDIPDLRLNKISGGNLRLTWSPSSSPYCNSYRIVQGSFDADFEKTGTHCPTQEDVYYDHYRKYKAIQALFWDMPMPAGNAYLMVQPVCNEITINDKQGDPFLCYNIDTQDTTWPFTVIPFTFNYLSEGSTGNRSYSVERPAPICECTNGGPTCGNYWPQPGDPWR